ncbi:hypothetical protein HPB51_012276 [Rhipicephalus microplus]|uniref:Uncharacterized protein n=1 Tax=Rhipicephalus microplus TaxID=6941 RepID=A0A9J6EGR4_RHIMP|nr:hypothetical protein HPB51_012276 [Rhipicephalus microplus]
MRLLDTYSGLTTTEPSGRRSALRVGDSVASSAPPVRKRVWFSSALSAMGLSDTDRSAKAETVSTLDAPSARFLQSLSVAPGVRAHIEETRVAAALEERGRGTPMNRPRRPIPASDCPET